MPRMDFVESTVGILLAFLLVIVAAGGLTHPRAHAPQPNVEVTINW